jgi:cell division protein FtsB
MQHNIFEDVAQGVNILGVDNNNPQDDIVKNVVMYNNLWKNMGAFNGAGSVLQLLAETNNIVWDRNTCLSSGKHLVMIGNGTHDNFQYTNNDMALGRYGIFGNGVGQGSAALDAYCPTYTVTNNYLVTDTSVANRYPEGNFFPAVGEEYTPVDAGVDMDALEAAMGGDSPPLPSLTPVPTTEPTPTPSATPATDPMDECLADVEELTTQVNALTSEVDTLTAENSELVDQVATLTAEVASLGNQIATLTAQVSTLTNENTSLREQVATLTTENEDLRRQLEEAGDGVSCLTPREVRQLERELRIAVTRYDNDTKRIEIMRELLLKLQEEKAKL